MGQKAFQLAGGAGSFDEGEGFAFEFGGFV